MAPLFRSLAGRLGDAEFMLGRTALSASGVGRYVLGVALVAGLLAAAVPSMSGVTWRGVVTALGGVSGVGVAVLVALWFVGLVAHTVTLTAALPTLTHRRAMTLSLTGSAVANVLPMGGAAGMALNYRMLSAWGYDAPQFATFTVVTNLWDVLAKLAVPLLVLPVVLLTPSLVLPQLGVIAAGVAVLAAVGAAVGAAALTSPRGALAVGTAVERLVGALLRAAGSRRRFVVTPLLVETQLACRDVVGSSWRRLTLGMTLYTTLLLALLASCLFLTGAVVPLSVVFVAFAVERLLTLGGITPGGVGLVELGLTGVLVVLGASAAAVVPGVLLYRALTFGLEIPVGGTALVGWLLLRRRNARLGVRVPTALGEPR